MFNTVINYVFMFFLFSAIGWAIECTYRSLGEKKIINSGFLYGPMCPIYGTGCLAFQLILVPLSQPIEKRLIPVLLLGMLVADIVEYATSYIMEKLFNARWWDYTGNFLNLHGRICFKHTCYWAIFAFAYTYIIAPIYNYVMSFIPQSVVTAAVFIILIILAVDLTLTVKAVADINKLLKKLYALKCTITEKAESVKNIPEGVMFAGADMFAEIKSELSHQYLDLFVKYKELESENNSFVNRFIAVPNRVRAIADNTIKEIEEIWNEVKGFFSDSE